MSGTARFTFLGLLGLMSPLVWRESVALDAAPASGDNSLETIVVTAEKREERLADVPMSVTALGGDLLEALQARDFADYAALVPGLSLTSSQPGLTRLTLRGENAGGIGSTVAVYIDESPFGSSTALLNGSTNTGDFDTWDMQRIEVLRGPQGTLYGANTEGGIIKFVTNAPQLGTLSGAGELGGEHVGNGSNGGDLRVMVNLPLGQIAAVRVSAFDQDVPGYISDPSRRETGINGGHKEGGRAALLLEPSSDLSIRLTASTQESSYHGENTVDVNPTTLQPVHGDLSQERTLREPSNFKYENYNATINWNVGPFRVLSSTSYGILETDTFSDYTPVFGGLAGALYGANTGAYLGDDVTLRKFTQEVRLISPTSRLLEWQVGGYFTHEIGSVNEHLDAVTLPGADFLGLLEQPIINSAYKESAGFGDLTWHINSQFDLQVGGRYSHNDQTAEQVVNFNPALAPAPQVINGSSNGNVFTYSVAPLWHVDGNDTVYARLATGYRPGGPNVIPPGAPPTVQTQYGADKTTNIELGVRSTQLNGALSLDVAVYHIDWKNIQLFEEVAGFGINGNGGKARSQGVEWEVAYSPLEALKFLWTGAYTDAKLTTPAPALDANSGDSLPYTSKWTTALDGEYTWPLAGSYQGFIGATFSLIGTRSSDFSVSTAATPVQIGLPSYNTTDLRLGVKSGRYTVTLYGKNLSDSRGITNFEGAGAPYTTVTVIQPRTVGLTLNAKF